MNDIALKMIRTLCDLRGLLVKADARGNSKMHSPAIDNPRRRHRGGAICFAFLASVGLLNASVVRAENFALLIGVGEFPRVKDVRINLPGIDIDLDRMQEIVINLGVPQENITRLFNESATLQNVVSAMRDHARRLEIDDRLYLYFSTHGGQITNLDDDPEVDGFDEFLVFHDLNVLLERDAPADARAPELEGVLLDDDLGDLLADIQATTIVVIDACSSATANKTLDLNKPQTDDTLQVSGKFISAGWMKKIGNRIAGRKRQPYETEPRDNLVVLAASQDRQDALATRQGSVFTNALHKALGQVPLTAVTPFCLHHFAYKEIKRQEYIQSPFFSGQYRIANQSLHDLNVSTLAAFNNCLGGEKLRVTKRKTNRFLGSQWQVEFEHVKEGYLFGYIESPQGISRVDFSQNRYAIGFHEIDSEGLEPEEATRSSWGAGLLVASVEDLKVLKKIDFRRTGWANQFNIHYRKISSRHSEF